MSMTRVEKHVIKASDQYFGMLWDFCHRAKNLYNHANFVVRESFIASNTWIRCADLDKILRTDTDYPDYRAMPTAKSAQQLLRLLDRNWISFFASIKDWSGRKDKYNGKPKMPKYLEKNGAFPLILTNQDCKIRGTTLKFPGGIQRFYYKSKVC